MTLSATPPIVHISPIPRPLGPVNAQGDGNDGERETQCPRTPQRKTPKKNEQETNEDFDRSFQIDQEALTLKKPLNNGEGGIGEVWVGELVDENGSVHDVAVKRYPSAWGPEEMKMFRRETQVLFLAAMRCHNVCKVYGTAVKEGKLCIVMKLYKESMRGLLGRSEGRKLGLEAVQRYGRDICKAIAELHEQNIILQDLKPPNILLDEYDHCVLADFGISRFVQGSNPHMPSHVQGTFNYMSPEAFDPEQFGGITVRTDSWSFACTLLEMLTGDQPWKDMKMAPICFKVMQRQVPAIPHGLPPVLECMLRQCFAFEPEKRPSFKEMFEVFRSEWTVTEQSGQPRRADPLGIGPILDVFRVVSDDSPSPNPRGSLVAGNKFKVTALNPPAAGASGRTSSSSDALQWAAASIDGDSSIAGLYKRAAEADEARRVADLAKREVEELKAQVAALREASENADTQVKDAITGKEEVVGQLSKVMGVCEELQNERKSLAQQLLDLQDQLMSQEKKISEDQGQLQSSEAARTRAEEQLAEMSAAYQESVQERKNAKHSSNTIQQLYEENEEMKTTVQNLVSKLEAVTQELISVTEERDQLDDDMQKLKKEALQLGKASSSIQEEYNDMRAALEEMRDVHQYELEQARHEHEAAASSAERMISQEKESADQKTRELESALQSAQQQMLSVQDQKDLLDRRLSQSALENVKIQEAHDRVCAQKQEMETELKRLSSLLEQAEYQRLTERSERYEKERAQWQHDRDSLQSCLKAMEDMEGRVNEADKRASTLASEKRQLESTRLRLESEAEAERARFENALAKQRSEYEKKILDLENAQERLTGNRDSISTSDDTLVTERSMGNSLEIKGDAFAMGSLDIRADAYEGESRQDEKKGKVPSSPQLWLASEIATNLRTPEAQGNDKMQVSQTSMDQDRVARVLHQLALECDKQSAPDRDIDIRATAPSHLLPPIAAATSLRSTLNGIPVSADHPRHSFGSDPEHGRGITTTQDGPSARPSSPPPALSLLGPSGAPASTENVQGLSRVSSSEAASPAQPRVLSTRRSLRMNDDESTTPRTPRESRSMTQGDATSTRDGAKHVTPCSPLDRAAGWTASSDPARAEEIFCNAVAAEAAQKRRHSSVAASAAVSAASASPAKPKGRSLGLMLDATRVARVVRGSPAHQAGLKPDDMIVKVNGIRVVKDDVGKILRMQWHGGAEALELTADRGGRQLSMRIGVQPDDVEISNSSSTSTDFDTALAWQMHENEVASLAAAEDSSVVC